MFYKPPVGDFVPGGNWLLPGRQWSLAWWAVFTFGEVCPGGTVKGRFERISEILTGCYSDCHTLPQLTND